MAGCGDGLIDDHAFRVAELVAAGDHDAVAFLHAFQQFHRAQAAGAGADRTLDRDVAVHDVGAGAAALFQERTAVLPSMT